jgi:hypothetical protein
VGCPCDRVIDARYRFWYVLGTVVPHCIILSIARLFATLSTRHVNANTNRHVNANTNLIQHPPHCRVIVIIVVLTLSAVHQWVGYLRAVARRAISIDRGI